MEETLNPLNRHRRLRHHHHYPQHLLPRRHLPRQRDEPAHGGSPAHLTQLVDRGKEAEKHASDDKRKKEAVEARNELDTMVYQAEKQISELGDKLTAEVKEPLEEALGEAKKVLENETAAVDLVLRPGQMSIHHACTVHGSMPNQGDERRMGIALQAYMGPDSRQTIGEHLVQVVRGCDGGGDFSVLPRPDADRDEAGVAARAQANANWADILYEGASKVRAY